MQCNQAKLQFCQSCRICKAVRHAEPDVHVDICRSDHRADIFSYGVLVRELITQERPERGVLRDLQVNAMCR